MAETPAPTPTFLRGPLRMLEAFLTTMGVNEAILLRTKGSQATASPATLEAAFRAAVLSLRKVHPVLRGRLVPFVASEGITPPGAMAIAQIDCWDSDPASVPLEMAEAALVDTADSDGSGPEDPWASRLNDTSGLLVSRDFSRSLFYFRLFTDSAGPGLAELHVSSNHCVIDGPSFFHIVAELVAEFSAHLSGDPLPSASATPLTLRDPVGDAAAAAGDRFETVPYAGDHIPSPSEVAYLPPFVGSEKVPEEGSLLCGVHVRLTEADTAALLDRAIAHDASVQSLMVATNHFATLVAHLRSQRAGGAGENASLTAALASTPITSLAMIAYPVAKLAGISPREACAGGSACYWAQPLDKHDTLWAFAADAKKRMKAALTAECPLGFLRSLASANPMATLPAVQHTGFVSWVGENPVTGATAFDVVRADFLGGATARTRAAAGGSHVHRAQRRLVLNFGWVQPGVADAEAIAFRDDTLAYLRALLAPEHDACTVGELVDRCLARA